MTGSTAVYNITMIAGKSVSYVQAKSVRYARNTWTLRALTKAIKAYWALGKYQVYTDEMLYILLVNKLTYLDTEV